MSPLSALRRSIAIASALAFLGGCGTGTINYVHVDSSYDPTSLAHIPYTGPLYADVSGNPFGIPQDDLQRLVNDAIQPSSAKAETGQGVRVHFAFGPTAADRSSACSMVGTPQMSKTISVVAALCRGGGSATTYLVGSVDDISGPSDPRFENFLRQVTVQLFPRMDPNRDTPCFLPTC
ncbi:hypothetical protein [Dongia sp.]|uniref:hypothetical protein n=1 Tax=Dongia sp. TaxID=1977262 RepID=UPI00375057EF